MLRRLLLPLVLLAALAVPGCSSSPAICSALDEGQEPITAARTAYGDAGGDSATAERMLRQGVSEVRASCPEHGEAAGAMENAISILRFAQ